MKRSRLVGAVLLASCLGWTVSLPAEEAPLAVGSDGVPVPKKVKDVKPRYPPEAVAQGIRGIVILDLVIDTTGVVESVSVVRSVPGLDDAAVAAASQWRYQPVKVAGRPARVRMTVPITFSLALPKLVRDAGVPELRQGVMPAFPRDAQGDGSAAVAVMLEPDGGIAVRGAMEGSEEPWTSALLAALDTWRFSPLPDDTVVSFRIEAEFIAGKRSDTKHVSLRATGLKVVENRSVATPAAPASDPARTAALPAPVVMPPAGPDEPQEPAASGALTGAGATPPAPPAGRSAALPTPPPLEVVTAPLPPPPLESGISAVRDVALEPGVPELARGRRPVPPPVARMAGATGTVVVAFSVSAAGATMVQTVTGPDVLKKAAEQAVASWVFRRTRADRAYLVAVFDYGEDKATASVRPQSAPANPSPAAPAAPESAAPETATPEAPPGP